MALHTLMAFTYLPGFVTLMFRGMPTVWRGRHRLILYELIFMQALHPGRHTLEEMARWTPAASSRGALGVCSKTGQYSVLEYFVSLTGP